METRQAPTGTGRSDRGGALDGVRVLDLSRVLAGPWCTMILADLGADVINVEHPQGGNDTRRWAPFNEDGESAYFLGSNRNKKSITVDISTTRGQEIVRNLAAQSDVVVENYKLGGLDKYGLDYESIRRVHPAVIYCSISGFGRVSPMAERAGYDLVMQAEGGLMSIIGEPAGQPMKVAIPIVDLYTGMSATQAILASLLYRHRTGEGQLLDIALIDNAVAMLSNAGAEGLMTGTNHRLGNAHPSVVPYQTFQAADAWFVVAVGNDRQFRQMCEVIGRPELAADPAFATNPARVTNRVRLLEILEEVFLRMPAQHWADAFDALAIPSGKIRTIAESLSSPEVTSRGMVMEVEHPTSGPVRFLGSPLRLSASPVRKPAPPPVLGQDTDSVMRERLGMSQEDVDSLRDAGVIGGRSKLHGTTMAR